jgi:hypothetical protein
MNILDRVALERAEQKTRKGYTPEHDDGHKKGELARAAISYLSGERDSWPFDSETYRPRAEGALEYDVSTELEARARVRDLIKAVALGIAEAERIEREFGIVPRDPKIEEILILRPADAIHFMRKMNAGSMALAMNRSDGSTIATVIYVVDPLDNDELQAAVEAVTERWAEESPADPGKTLEQMEKEDEDDFWENEL